MGWVEKRAMEIAFNYEIQCGNHPIDVSKDKKKRGFDIQSNEKMIEVKGISEKWGTYNWQALHVTTNECLENNNDKFYLYIVKFHNKDINSDYDLYVIPGQSLKNEFNRKIETYRLTPISKEKLERFIKPDHARTA